ncbi:hypothetical protein ACKF11_13595 [Methylobacillus sp. Pita2]|uniref:hypothetical protein n=1 Tax=Methylobacillus sp. Pita2 TaxID=3383245 RepID=UPI0038B44E21
MMLVDRIQTWECEWPVTVQELARRLYIYPRTINKSAIGIKRSLHANSLVSKEMALEFADGMRSTTWRNPGLNSWVKPYMDILLLEKKKAELEVLADRNQNDQEALADLIEYYGAMTTAELGAIYQSGKNDLPAIENDAVKHVINSRLAKK